MTASSHQFSTTLNWFKLWWELMRVCAVMNINDWWIVINSLPRLTGAWELTEHSDSCKLSLLYSLQLPFSFNPAFIFLARHFFSSIFLEKCSVGSLTFKHSPFRFSSPNFSSVFFSSVDISLSFFFFFSSCSVWSQSMSKRRHVYRGC